MLPARYRGILSALAVTAAGAFWSGPDEAACWTALLTLQPAGLAWLVFPGAPLNPDAD
ncbi:MAG TPA: hypothetical protein VFB01_16030 [Burkholderiales bacterium]|nr:hypothetical protein [Burkholderiales bacterium]